MNTWRRIQQLLAIARCRTRPEIIVADLGDGELARCPLPVRAAVVLALADLHMEGFRVEPPMESPEALGETAPR